ncbi:MAG: hypothetical protein ABSA05_16500 [Opitutaceae bacterium]
MNLKIRIALLAPFDQCWKYVWSKRLYSAHGNLAFEGRRIAQFLRGILHFEKNSPRSLEKGCPRFRQDGAASQAMEKLVTELLFKIYNLLT